MYKNYKYIYTYIIHMYIYVYEIHICTCIRRFFPKKFFHGETLGGHLWGGVAAHRGTYDNIMSREWGAL